ncbi:interleukin-6 receptor subunit beta-like [Pseudorasbora parva]|uniref:interleukin-6 receptor subunit beta-like n=1 Tax=Pseudorasbora parva TaxID=51549 RepID=UPI00351E266F
MDASHNFFLLLMFLHYAIVSSDDFIKIVPNSIGKIPVEVGTNFTVTCHLLEGSGSTSDDIEWIWGNVSIEKQYYHKINETSVSVTVNITSDMKGWLRCQVTLKTLPVKRTNGIFIEAGYLPLKPKNLTCIAVQEGNDISPNLKCYWEPGSRDPLLDTTYTLYADEGVNIYKGICNQKLAKSCTVNLGTFPNHMSISVWVEVKNALGSVQSDDLTCSDALCFVKLNPPLDVQAVAEVNFPSSLMVTWKRPIDILQKITYVIRYCQVDSDVWLEVPESFTQAHTDSFRLQSLEPFTEYVVQMRCTQEGLQSYWSDWSANTTIRTAEDNKPITFCLSRLVA